MNNKMLAIITVLTLAACGGGNSSNRASGTAADKATVQVISNRPDLVSAGDVLVEVVLASADASDELVLLRNNTDVTSVLQSTPDNPLRLLGVVEGLSVGENLSLIHI